MNGQPTGGRSARTRAAALAASAVVVAVLGAALIATPANASTIGDATDCLTSTSTVLADLGAATSLTGALQSTASDATGVVSCTTGAVLGTGSDPGSTSAPHQPVSRVKKPSGSDGTTATSTDPTGTGSTTTTSASTGASRTLGSLTLDRSSTTVYPVKDGYRDTVKIAVRAADADGDAVAVQGSAVLSKAGRSLRTWAVDGTNPVITWNGRVGGAIRTGLYTITVTAWSADGSKLSSSTRIRVLSKHLEKRALVVRSDVGAKSVSADLPRKLLKAYAMGEVTVRVRTVARVVGRARLVFSSTTGVVRFVTLRNGTRTTPSLPVPAGFSHVTITHDWKKGAAHLEALQAIWSYYTLS